MTLDDRSRIRFLGLRVPVLWRFAAHATKLREHLLFAEDFEDEEDDDEDDHLDDDEYLDE